MLEKIIKFLYSEDVFDLIPDCYTAYLFGFISIYLMVAENRRSNEVLLILPLLIMFILYFLILAAYKPYRYNDNRKKMMSYLFFMNINLLVIFILLK